MDEARTSGSPQPAASARPGGPAQFGGDGHPDLTVTIGEAILDTMPQGIGGQPRSLALVAHTARADDAVRDLLRQSVGAARADGQSWAAIGAALGMSGQAVQERFGDALGLHEAGGVAQPEYRWLGPVTAFDEMTELERAGRQGWHTIEADVLRHLVVRTPTRWEHKRVMWSRSRERWAEDGWQVGATAFPWIYLIRDTGKPAEPLNAD